MIEQIREALKKAEAAGKKVSRLEKALDEAEKEREAALAEVQKIVGEHKAARSMEDEATA